MFPSPKLISKKRKVLGLTQKQLAKKAGISQSLIAKFENGLIDPSYTKVKAIFETLQRLENKKEVHAKDIFNEKVIGISLKASVSEAVKLMKEYGYSQLPVFKGDNAVGSISEKTVLKQLLFHKELNKLSSLTVEEIMEEGFPQIGEEAPLSLVSDLLQYYSAILVTKKGKVIGLITKADLLKMLK